MKNKDHSPVGWAAVLGFAALIGVIAYDRWTERQPSDVGSMLESWDQAKAE